MRTRSRLLVFDYFRYGTEPDEPGLANGCLVPREIAGLDIVVFVTHHHPDHFDPAIFDFAESHGRVSYVFGFDPAPALRRRGRSRPGDLPGYTLIGPREQRTVDGIEIETIRSTDSGVAFVVDIEGLVIYHSGDHSNVKEGLTDEFTGEIDHLAAGGFTADIAVLPYGTPCGGGAVEGVKLGNYYTVEKLRPKAVFPQHGRDRERDYRKCADEISARGLDTRVGAAMFKGDRFFYAAGRLTRR